MLFSVENELFSVVKYTFGVGIGGHSAQAGRALSKARRLGLKMSGPARFFRIYIT
jgi:hypothetical protein